MKGKKKSKRTRLILLSLLAAFVFIQFVPVDKSVPKVEENLGFMAITKPSDEIKDILVTACYDCHSYKTEYPWYSSLAPVSFYVQHHIDEGREELNFSEWGEFSMDKKNHKLHECAEMTEDGDMPLTSYTITHGDAKLDKAQKALLAEWFESLMEE